MFVTPECISVLLRKGHTVSGHFVVQVALQAIFSNPNGEGGEEERFKIDEDEQGLSIKVVPHPGDAEANFVWAELGIRCASP